MASRKEYSIFFLFDDLSVLNLIDHFYNGTGLYEKRFQR